MLELIEKLLILQHGDQQIRDLNNALKQLPQEKAACEIELKKTHQSLENILAHQREAELEVKKLEGDILSKREQVVRYRKQQLETRKNDEYAALSHEIELGEKAIQELEDRELGFLEKVESLKIEAEKAQEAYSIEQKRIHDLLKTLDDRKDNLELRKKELLEQRPRLTERIDEDQLDQFERLFKSKQGTAIVPVEHGICTGCHMKVTLQISLSAKAGKELTSCSQCGRWLYSEEE